MICSLGTGIGGVALSLEFFCQFTLMIVEKSFVGYHDQGQTESHAIEDCSGACICHKKLLRLSRI